MQGISPRQAYPLFNTEATRRIEQAAAARLPPHTLMQRAGAAIARLAQAVAPHASTIWIACGPGNNGGDGLEAAMHLQRSGRRTVVTWLGHPARCPGDARASWARAQQAGVEWSAQAPQTLTAQDLCIDALLGLGVHATPGPSGTSHPLGEDWRAVQQALQHSPAPVLAVDLPSGLDADTGQFVAGWTPPPPKRAPRHTLSLLTLKPGLFTAAGRDTTDHLWLDDLGIAPGTEPPSAWLTGPTPPLPRQHASHKGRYGDVAVVGGEGIALRGMGMTGAALLAASAALHGGAGRVLVALLDTQPLALDPQQPELMFRHFETLELEQLTVVCGCGGGQAVEAVLPQVLARAPRLVLDADALNAVARNPTWQALLRQRVDHGQTTVLTPHPLEAARLLGTDSTTVQSDRLHAAQTLAGQFRCIVVLKGSGTVIASPEHPPHINPTGNGRLATAGTGDVLAGLVGARLAAGNPPQEAAVHAVFAHGLAADQWPPFPPLTAGALARGAMSLQNGTERPSNKHQMLFY